MATGTTPSVIKDLEEATQCPICLETFVDPRALPCMHVVCIKCIKSLVGTAEAENRSRIKCPLCQKEIQIPTPSEQFPVAFFVNNLADILNKTKQSGTGKCQLCAKRKRDSPAEWICFQCPELLCSRCKECHDDFKAEHVCIEVCGLTAESVQRCMSKQTQLFCSKHDEKLNYICEDCDTLLCTTCKLTDNTHKDHNTLYAQDEAVVQSHKQRIVDFNDKGKQILHDYEKCVTDVKQKASSKNTQVDECIQTIKQRYTDMVASLSKHKDCLIQKAEDERRNYSKAIERKVAELKGPLDELKVALETTEGVTEQGTHIDIINCSIQQLKQYERLTQLKPNDVVCTNTLQTKFDRDVADVQFVFGDLECNSDCNIVSSVISSVELGNINGPTGLDVLPDNNIMIAEYNTNNVMVFSPSGSMVSRLDKGGPLVKAWNVNHSGGYIYVSEYDTDCVHKYGKDYKHLLTIETGINGPTGFAILGETLYLASSDDKCVYKLSLDNPTQKKKFATHAEMKNPRFVETDGQILVVTCFASNNIIGFDLEGNPKFVYGGLPKGNGLTELNIPMGISIDQYGHIIVADRENKRLIILSQSGQLCGCILLEDQPCNVVLTKSDNMVVSTFNKAKLVTLNYSVITTK